MKAIILSAGLGTRLKPWTDSHPKALVPVKGVPMLERVIISLRTQGFDDIVVNVHHFADQILEFLNSKDLGVKISISDERDRLLDTGGAILKAAELLRLDEGPALIHNVDILSDSDLRGLMAAHIHSGADSTLLVNDRNSSRKLIFDQEMNLRGWHHLSEDRYLPKGFVPEAEDRELAFSGIHVIGDKIVREMKRIEKDPKFPVMDFLLSPLHTCKVKGYEQDSLKLLDIGKPATLSQAELLYD